MDSIKIADTETHTYYVFNVFAMTLSCVRKAFCVIYLFIHLFIWWYWGLNSGFHACESATL
jgi:hypothetical protein